MASAARRDEMDRQRAWRLLCEYTQSPRVRAHGLAVEAVMRGHAPDYGGDPDLWGITGLLHDFDYERWPDQHPATGTPILEREGYPPEMVEAIAAHADHMGLPRRTHLARCLYASDELSGFVVACARVRPDGFVGLEPRSVMKKLKDKAFARGVNREEVRRGMEELGVDPLAHIGRIVDCLAPLGPVLLDEAAEAPPADAATPS
jgi:putative nucleotidyltransferase with HDIG domain